MAYYGGPSVHPLLEPAIGKYYSQPYQNALDGAVDLTRSLKALIEYQSRHTSSSQTFSKLLTSFASIAMDLVNHETKEIKYKIAGLCIFDCLLDITDENNVDRKIEIANYLRKVLENEKFSLDVYAPVIRIAALIIGHFSRVANTNEIEFLQNFFLPIAFRLLTDTNSVCHKFAGGSLLTQLALNSPALIFAQRRELFKNIWDVVCDRNATVRQAAAEALEAGLQLVSQRSYEAMDEYLIQGLKQVNAGFSVPNAEKVIGSLLILDIIVGGIVVSFSDLRDKMLAQNVKFEDMIWKVLQRKDSADVSIKNKVIDIIPNLANAFQATFLEINKYTTPSNFLQFTIQYLMDTIRAKKLVSDRPNAYISLGKLVVSMSNSLRSQPSLISDVHAIIQDGFKDPFCIQALQCLGMVMNALPAIRKYTNHYLIDSMFRGGLTHDLIETLKIILKHVPSVRAQVQTQLLHHIKSILLRYAVVVDEGQGNQILTQGRSLSSIVNFRSSLGKAAGAGSSAIVNASNSSSSSLIMGVGVGVGVGGNGASINGNSSSSALTNGGTVGGVGVGGGGTRLTVESMIMPSSKGGVASSSSGASPSMWGGVFGSLITDSLAAQVPNADAHIILALKVLASLDFFPKQFRTSPQSSVSGGLGGEIDQSANLMKVVRGAVMRYLDDFNPEIRLAAAQTCIAILDIIVLSIDTASKEYHQILHVVDHLLMMGVGDDSQEIRNVIMSSLTPSLDHAISQSQNIHCLIESIDDESMDVRTSGMSVLSRVAHYDTLHLMPVLTLSLKQLLRQLQSSADMKLRHESVQLLQAMVRGSTTLILPFVKQILKPLMTLLNDEDPSSAVVGAVLSTIGDLAVTCPESVREHLDDLFPRLIDALNDESSLSKQEVAVIAIGKLVSSLTMVTEEPYTKYPGLFEGLVRAIQTAQEGSAELRLQAIHTMGLLGAVQASVYQKHLRANAVVADAFAVQNETVDDVNVDDDFMPNNGGLPAAVIAAEEDEMKLTKMEKYYYSIVIRELMNILRDPSLSTFHQSAAATAVKVVKTAGTKSLPLLSQLTDGIIGLLYRTEPSNNLRDSLLEHVITLIHVIGRSMRKHHTTLVKLVCDFFDSHLHKCLDIIESLSLVFLEQEFNLVLRDVLPKILQVIHEEPLGGDFGPSGVGPGERMSGNMNDKVLVRGQGDAQSASGLVGATQLHLTSGKSNRDSKQLPGTNPLVRSNFESIMNQGFQAVQQEKKNVDEKSKKSSRYTKTSRILQTIANMSASLGEYRTLLISTIIQVMCDEDATMEIRKQALCTLIHLGNDSDLNEFGGRIIHPLIRLVAVNDQALQAAVFVALSCLLCRLQAGFLPYIIPIRRKLRSIPQQTNAAGVTVKLPQLEEFEGLVSKLLKQRPIPLEPSDASLIAVVIDDRLRVRLSKAKENASDLMNCATNMQALETAWALAGRNSASDLIEWMRRLSIEMIRQSPSPIIRSCAMLAKAHRPLAERLFNVSFICIWDECFAGDSNDVVDDIDLIKGIEMALQSHNIPSKITFTLLNLAEFMDMQGKRLPLDVQLLARKAQSSNIFAKSLRYRELEFNSSNVQPSDECIEALITINNELGLLDRATGVLHHVSTQYRHQYIQPLWLEKLFRWDEAKQSYMQQNLKWEEEFGQESPARYPQWMSSELGELRCLRALGEFEELEAKARKLKDSFRRYEENQVEEYNVWMSEIQKMGSNASWMLGHWDIMGEFIEVEVPSEASVDVELQDNMSFYKAILAIHRQDFSQAINLIAETRNQLVNGISALLSESYSRAYRAMLSMQVLAEMDEIVEYKETVTKAAITLDTLNSNSQQQLNITSPSTISRSISGYRLDDIAHMSLRRSTSGAKLDELVLKSANGGWGVRGVTNGNATVGNIAGTEAPAQRFDLANAKVSLLRKWRGRLKWAPKDVDVYRQILSVRTLVAEPMEDLESWLELVTLCRKEKMFSLCENILRQLGAPLGAKVIPITSTSVDVSDDFKAVVNDSKVDSFIHDPSDSQIKAKVSEDADPDIAGALSMDTDEEGPTGVNLFSSGPTSPAMSTSGSSIVASPVSMPLAVSLSQSTASPSTNPVSTPAAASVSVSVPASSGTTSVLSPVPPAPPQPPSQPTFTLIPESSFLTTNRRVILSTFKYFWSCGRKEEALANLTNYLAATTPLDRLKQSSTNAMVGSNTDIQDARYFRVRCLLKRAEWMRELDESPLKEVLDTVKEAREIAPEQYSVWHAWAVTNYDYLKRADQKDTTSNKDDSNAKLDAGREVPGGIDPSSASSSAHTTPPRSIRQGNPILPSTTPRADREAPLTGGGAISKQLRIMTPGHHKVHSFTSITGSASLANLLSVNQEDQATTPYIINAIEGFVRSIVLGHGQPVANILQDTLRLLTLWFTYGSKEGVVRYLKTELDRISPDNWLSVIPQLIARMHLKSPEITGLLRKLLNKLAATHPQALVCPISVALNTSDRQQKQVAMEVIKEMRMKNSALVDEATLVSRELMRVAVTPHELWHDGLEKAASCYLEFKDIPGMLAKLSELHEAMNDTTTNTPYKPQGFSENMGKIGKTSLRDISFRLSHERQLSEAQGWLELFRSTGRTADLHQAWEIYQIVFKKIKAQISIFIKNKMELPHVSPALTHAVNLQLAVPGTYKPPNNVICISGFSHTVTVMPSKQRPRRISLTGSDGQQYQFLLKGNEDLRQDERVMQLFGLINVCLDNDRGTSNRGLAIVRYSVLPLSNNSGVIGWVDNCDTVNALIQQYRESNGVSQLIECRLVRNLCPATHYERSKHSDPKSWGNYTKLPLLQKVEIFKQVLDDTTGHDVSKMIWLKSKTSDVWVERRANYTKSMAVMSMVGYILGLGDRHPSNLMLDRVSGRVVHIDFGDCFEVTAKRSVCPEIVPFRLTRMLTTTMGDAGIEGTYRVNCERTMRVIRDNRDSVMAMLEAFVYDPLISWRLLTKPEVAGGQGGTAGAVENLRDKISMSPRVGGGLDEGEDGALTIKRTDLAGTGDGSKVGGVGGGGAPGASGAEESERPISMAMTLSVAASMIEGKRRHNSDLSHNDEPATEENLNARALEVITRIQAKLTGRDFCKSDDDDDFLVEQQVDRLIKEATSVENLCQMFTGWCPLW